MKIFFALQVICTYDARMVYSFGWVYFEMSLLTVSCSEMRDDKSVKCEMCFDDSESILSVAIHKKFYPC